MTADQQERLNVRQKLDALEIEGADHDARIHAVLDRYEEAITALREIRDMPEYDQDDIHRLRHKARTLLRNQGRSDV